APPDGDGRDAVQHGPAVRQPAADRAPRGPSGSKPALPDGAGRPADAGTSGRRLPGPAGEADPALPPGGVAGPRLSGKRISPVPPGFRRVRPRFSHRLHCSLTRTVQKSGPEPRTRRAPEQRDPLPVIQATPRMCLSGRDLGSTAREMVAAPPSS